MKNNLGFVKYVSDYFWIVYRNVISDNSLDRLLNIINADDKLQQVHEQLSTDFMK